MAEAKKSNRVYSILDNVSGGETLVRAAGLQTAIAHVAAKQFAGRLLKGGELLDKIGEGAKVETAGEEAQGAAPAPEATDPLKVAAGADESNGGNDGNQE